MQEGPAAAEAQGDEMPSLEDILGKLDDQERDLEEELHGRVHMPLALHDEQKAGLAAAAHAQTSLDQLIWYGDVHLARAVVLWGPGVIVLPLLGSISHVKGEQALAYGSHAGSLLDQSALEASCGVLDPASAIKELQRDDLDLRRHLSDLGDEAIEREIRLLQSWHRRARTRLRALESRVAWALLGIEYTNDTRIIRRAFKKKALELHPDKGGDLVHFQLLQEMKGILVVAPETKTTPEEQTGTSTERDSASKNEPTCDDRGAEDAASCDSESDADAQDVSAKKPQSNSCNHGEEYDWMSDLGSKRENLVATRKKIRGAMFAVRERVHLLTIRLLNLSEPPRQQQAHTEALCRLREFVESFAARNELSALAGASARHFSPRHGEELLRGFLEEGSEMLCVAGALNPTATVSEVALKFTHPLLEATRSSSSLEERCAALLRGVSDLPQNLAKVLERIPCEPAEQPGVDTKPNALQCAGVDTKLNALQCADDNSHLGVVAGDELSPSSSQRDAKVSQESTPKPRPGRNEFQALKQRWGWQAKAGSGRGKA